MAISICFGLLVATGLTLLYVPALYLIVRDVRNSVLARLQRKEVSEPITDGRRQIADK
jgi:hypothetical protein